MKHRTNRNPDKVYVGENGKHVCGLGSEWRCPECGTIFLVPTEAWGYILNGRKYCSHKCLRAVEKRKSR